MLSMINSKNKNLMNLKGEVQKIKKSIQKISAKTNTMSHWKINIIIIGFNKTKKLRIIMIKTSSV